MGRGRVEGVGGGVGCSVRLLRVVGGSLGGAVGARRARTGRWRRGWAGWWLAVLVGSVLLSAAGCGAIPSTSSSVASGSSYAPIPDGVTIVPESPAPPVNGCVASLRPQGPLPAPGRMPAGSTMARIQQRGYLIAGVDEDSYLFGYRNPSSDPSAAPLIGFDIDFVRAVAQAIFGSPDKVRYETLTKAERLTALSTGQVDMTVDVVTIDCQRAQQVAFSADYLDGGQRILVNQSSTISDVAGLAGKKACAAAGTTSIQTIADPKYHVIPVSAVNWADCLVMLQQGQVDAITTTDIILLGLQIQDPYTKIVGPRFTFEQHGFAVPLGEDDFVRFLNGVLEQVEANGTWTAIYSKWLGTRLGPVPAPPQPAYKD